MGLGRRLNIARLARYDVKTLHEVRQRAEAAAVAATNEDDKRHEEQVAAACVDALRRKGQAV